MDSRDDIMRRPLTDDQEKKDEPLIQRVSPFLQFLLIAISILLWIMSSVFVAIGAYAITQSDAFRELSHFAMGPGIMFVVLGFVIFISSMVGILGTSRQNLKLLNAYKIMLVSILIFEVSIIYC